MTSQDDVQRTREDRVIHRWLQERAVRAPRPDRDAVMRQTIHRIPSTSQRRRWWTWRRSPASTDTTRDVGAAGRMGTGRPIPMFGTTRAFATVAAVVLGSTLLIYAAGVRPTAPQAGAPAAETGDDVRAAATFEGIRLPFTSMEPGTAEPWRWPDGSETAGNVMSAPFQADDPRMEGVATASVYEQLSGSLIDPGVFWGPLRIDNRKGSWQGLHLGGGIPASGADGSSAILVGDGAYEGMFAALYFDDSSRFRGIIREGEPPLEWRRPEGVMQISGEPTDTSVSDGAIESAASIFSGTRGAPRLTRQADEPWRWPDGRELMGSFQEGSQEADDTRLTGDWSASLYQRLADTDLGSPGQFWGEMRVETAGGDWTGAYAGAGLMNDWDASALLVGGGAYAGQYAVVFYGDDGSMRGVILDDEPPLVLEG